MNCSNNYDGSNPIGNGEVDSSILSGSTSLFRLFSSLAHLSHTGVPHSRRERKGMIPSPLDTRRAA
jgi:hypothetical protein